MKTINSDSSNYEIFLDPKTNEYLGFSGKVKVHSSEVYVNTKTGEGYSKVIEKLNKLIGYLASKYNFKGFALEDTKQHIAMRILEGIPKFDPRKGTKLSTFIQMRVNRRLINELRDERHMSKNATYLNINSFSYLCECGHSFSKTISINDDHAEVSCDKCDEDKNIRRVSVGFSEVSLDSHFSYVVVGEDDTEGGSYDMVLSNQNAFTDEDIILKKDIDSWMSDEDPVVVELVKLMLFKDYSVNRAAKEVGLSNAGANVKLKNLKNNKLIKDIFGK